jgi:hypothetical protein
MTDRIDEHGMTWRRCKKCGEEFVLDLDHFRRSSSGRGFRSACKHCGDKQSNDIHKSGASKSRQWGKSRDTAPFGVTGKPRRQLMVQGFVIHRGSGGEESVRFAGGSFDYPSTDIEATLADQVRKLRAQVRKLQAAGRVK